MHIFSSFSLPLELKTHRVYDVPSSAKIKGSATNNVLEHVWENQWKPFLAGYNAYQEAQSHPDIFRQ